MRELALFAGVGGGILGGKLLGWETVCAVEINEYCRRVLMQRQDDGVLEPFPIWGDIRTFRGRPWRGLVDVVSGGFPCTDISIAGKGTGIDGQHSGLWSEMARVICEVRPDHVLVENSPALIDRGLGRVLADLASLGFDARWGMLRGTNVGAPHLRERLWIVAHANSAVQRRQRGGLGEKSQAQWQVREPHAIGRGSYGGERDQPGASAILASRTGPQMRSGPWALEPGLARLGRGYTNRVERTSATGNIQIPRMAALAWRVFGGPVMNPKHDAAG